MKYIFLAGLITIAFVIISGTFNLNQAKDETKSIQYKTLATKTGFEIREYPELAIATTDLNSNSYSKNSNTGFRKIAS